MRKYFDEITQISGNVVTVRATGVGYEELAVVAGRTQSSLASVIRLEGDQVSLQVFAGTQGVSTGDRVRFFGRPMQVPFSEDLLGRVFDGAGRPRDGRPEVEAEPVEIGGPPVNPVCRRVPDRMIRTGMNRRNCPSSRCPASRITTCWPGWASRPRPRSSCSAGWASGTTTT